MKVVIKSQPEDFVVEEISHLRVRKKGPFGVYLLTKKNWNTVELLGLLAKRLKIPSKKIAYGGKKDRHGLTSQFITIEGPRQEDIKEDGFSLGFRGFADRPMGPDLIEGNHFKVTVRKLSVKDVDLALRELEQVQRFGYPNYFDDQRFGSYDPEHGFLGERLLKGHFNGALKTLLVSGYSEDRKEARERKRFFAEYWRDWKKCAERAATPYEREIFASLQKDPNGFLSLLKLVPREKLSLYFSAYQSFLWNEVTRRVIRGTGLPLRSHPGRAGDYLFYGELPAEIDDRLRTRDVPTADAKARASDPDTSRIYEAVLTENGVRRPMFNNLKTRQAFFKSSPRKLLLFPATLRAAAGEDELNAGRRTLALEFALPRGSYGTMLVKRLFAEPSD